MLAHLIDCLITLLAMTGVWMWVISLSSIEQMLNGLLVLVGILIISSWGWMFYVSIMTSRFGGTIGKLLTGIEIVNGEGKRISFWRAFFRNIIGYSVSGMAFSLGFVWILIDKPARNAGGVAVAGRRAWHDMMAGTMVVMGQRPTSRWLGKNGWIMGIAGMILLVGAIGIMGWNIVGQVKQNLPFYQSIIEDVMQAVSETKN